jgi:hypothetical protein
MLVLILVLAVLLSDAVPLSSAGCQPTSDCTEVVHDER